MEKRGLEAIGPDPVAEEQFHKGFELAQEGRLDEAIQAVEAAAAVSPEESRYQDLLGTLYAKKGIYDMAVAAWQKSIELDPDHAEVFRRIETAEKMRTKIQSRPQQWTRMAVPVLLLTVILALAGAVYTWRSWQASRSSVDTLSQELTDLKATSVPASEYEGVLVKLETQEKRTQDLEKELEEARSSFEAQTANMVPRSELEQAQEAASDKVRKLQEDSNSAQSQIKDLRKQNEELAAAAELVVSGTAGNDVLKELEQLRTAKAALGEDYGKLVKQLKTVTTERDAARAELEALSVLPVQSTGAGAPVTAAVEPASATTESAVVGAASPTMTVTSQPTPTATRPPTPVPTRKPTAKPTPRPTARPRATATPTTESARLRPAADAQPRPTRAPQPPADNAAERRARVMQLTDAAAQSIREGDLRRAVQLTKEARRLAPDDPRVRQLMRVIDEQISRRRQ